MTDRVLQKLKTSLENGDFYGAHQMYLTVCSRYIKSCKIDEAVELLLSGAKLLCQHQQYSSGLELASVLFKTWTDNRILVDEISLEKVFQLFECFPSERKEFLELSKHAIKWSISCGQSNDGEPVLHHQIGLLLAKNDFNSTAKKHLILGTPESAESLAILCANAWKLENMKKSSEEILLEPIVLYLHHQRISHALIYFKTLISQESLSELTSKTSSVETPITSSNEVTIFPSPMLNFAQFLILTCQRGPAAMRSFVYLRQKYHETLIELPSIYEELDKVGEIIFEMRPTRTQNANPLQSLISSFMGL